jgi:hypothetical protein
MQQESRTPSNRMPAFVPPRMSIVGWIVLAALAAGVIYLCLSHPMFALAVPIIAAVSWALNVVEKRRQRRIAIERQAESICTFARSFDCRATDTWIVRAVFEELASYVKFPIRPDDRLEDDLKVDFDDIDDIAEAIAQRTNRPLENYEANPLYRKVTTVRELVEFFVHQTRRKRPAA